MTIADKLTLLASSKEALRVKLGLPESLPFSEYHKLAIRKSFEPTDLFIGGKQGVWLDPSDKSTLFQDVAGTVPVTTDGDPVGLILDKSRGLELGAELVSNGDFSDGLNRWTANSGEWSVTGGSATKVLSSVYAPLAQNIGLVPDKTYKVSFDVIAITGVMKFATDNAAMGRNSNQQTISTTGTHIIYFTVEPNTDHILLARGSSAFASSFTVDNVSVKEIKGNHAIQSVSAARPIYKKDVDKAWLYNDKIDDELLVELPAMTATVVKATDEGVSIDYPVNITAGDYAITPTSALGRDYGYLIINKELSVSEITQVTNYFNAKRGV